MVFDVKKILLEYLNGMFVRKGKCENPMANLAGDVELPYNTKYRILGMRPSRDEGISHDYDVMRIWSSSDGDHPREGNHCVMKLAYSDSSDNEEFMHECRMLIALSDEYPNYRQRRHFPEILGFGSLKTLSFHCKRADDDYNEVKLNNPRPFFIMERLPMTLEECRGLSRNKYVDPHLAIFLTIGAIKALRVLHEMGCVMREVSPARFSVRLPPSGLLNRYTSEISDRVAVNCLTYATRYRGKRGVAESFVGNFRYSSPDALENKKQMPKDDIISVLFIMLEFLLGSLPWEDYCKESARSENIRQKAVTMKSKDLTDKGVQIFQGFSDLFKTLNEGSEDAIPAMPPYAKLYVLLQQQTQLTKADVTVVGTHHAIKKNYVESSQEKIVVKTPTIETKED